MTFAFLSILIAASAMFYFSRDSEPKAIDGHEASRSPVQSVTWDDIETSPRPIAGTTALKNQDKFLAAIGALENPVRTMPPYARYTSNLPAAQAGMANAQYEVSQAIQYCSEVPEQSRLAVIRADSELDPLVMSAIELKFAECVDLRTLVSESGISAGGVAWLEMSARQGHPLATIRLNMYEQMDPALDRRSLFVDALKLRHPDIYNLMALYHAVHNSSDPAELQAWSVHRCNNDPICSPEEVLSNIVDGMHEHEAVAIVDRVIEIRSAIDSENWELLIPSF